MYKIAITEYHGAYNFLLCAFHVDIDNMLVAKLVSLFDYNLSFQTYFFEIDYMQYRKALSTLTKVLVLIFDPVQVHS